MYYLSVNIWVRALGPCNILSLYDDTSHYTTIRHNICLKTGLSFCKVCVIKHLHKKHGRKVHVHTFIGDNHGE